jgi:hypothetical protein
MKDQTDDVHTDVHIVAAELHTDGIVVKFEDGQCIFYSAALLAESIPRAGKLDESAVEW